MTSSLVTPLKNRRVGAAVAAALCALALTSCGTETAGGGTPAGAGARTGAARIEAPAPVATPTPTPTAPVGDPADDPRLTPEQQAAEFRLLELAVDLAEPCVGGPPPLPPEVPTTEPEGPPPAYGEKSPSGPPLADEEAPSAKPWDFERARQETELSDVDRCVAPLHGKRIAKALDGKADPAPASVEKVLHSLGYDVDHRLHGPQAVNGKVEFTLDLRFMGGELCLTGRYDGTRTSFDPYGASPEVRCTDVKRRA
ncbi:hypothetical protein [Streptomyces sp. NPDC093795]|uniref:hypothetical protein n=1 Tax=Streptomyces sp. NPDC093795 TaxID=3366051 RepID=UPI003803D31E